MFNELLRELTKEIVALAPDKIGDTEVMQLLQKHFYPYESKPKDTFVDKFKADF